VPLFETISDLAGAPDILRELFAIPVYRSYLATRGNIQEIMLGYSDSNKDGGYFPANWSLYSAEKNIAKVNEALCEGCGACVAACPSGATGQKNYSDNQILEMIRVSLED